MNRLPAKWKAHLITAIMLTFFLAFIDEGYYDFRWMSDPGNWIAVVFYVGIIWAFQLLLAAIFDRIIKDPFRTWFSTFAGSFLALLFLFYIVFSHV